ncbi:MAG: alpha-ketoacid dehydrogenase subunit beta [Chloroflexi bacterium]|nr:alpha-ketoacid dehydrogenase subunit beta [Chloroflexota bacterium]
MARELKFFQAINEAIDLCLAKDPTVYIMGLGVPDPKGIFGSTLGLQPKYGSMRVMDMPAAENGMTGVAIGSALVGMRPIMTHQRVDFALLALEQIVNQAANWHYMFGGQASVPLTIRMIIGRGWGQGAQHSQSLSSLFMHIPGLKVVLPATPYDAKGLLIASIEDNNPVIFMEHRWLYNTVGQVPEGVYRVPLGKANIIRKGEDITIVSTSYMTLESIKASDFLAKSGVGVEVVDIRSLKPLDEELILQSVRKTGRLIVADLGWRTAGAGAEILARVAENAFHDLKCPMKRIALPDVPTPTSPALARAYYPRAIQIVHAVKDMLGIARTQDDEEFELADSAVPHDVPDDSFTGPF